MSEQDYKWLKEEFPQYLNKSLIRGVEKHYYKAEMLLNGWDQIKKRSCSCQYRGLKNSVVDKYNKWLHNEETLSNGQ